MKRLNTFMVGLMVVIAASADAGTGEVTGTIQIVRSHDETVSSDWVSINTSQASGTCRRWGAKPLFMFKDNDRGNRQFSLAMAAKLAAREVTVGFDDINLKNGSYCYARYIDLVQ